MTKDSIPDPKSDRPEARNSGVPNLPWMQWEVGQRVVVRYRKPDGFYDALGHLLEVRPDYVIVDTRKGPVKVLAETMVTGKRVPESPWS